MKYYAVAVGWTLAVAVILLTAPGGPLGPRASAPLRPPAWADSAYMDRTDWAAMCDRLFNEAGFRECVRHYPSAWPWAQTVTQAQAACGVHCGTERWAVKTASDADTGRIDWRVYPTTVAQLRAVRAPPRDSLPENGRLPFERHVYGIRRAVIVGWKMEVGDSDLHLVVADPGAPTATMIAEVPAAGCAGVCRSSEAADIALARATIIRALGRPPLQYRTLRRPRAVELAGLGFFDVLHGQTGVAPNGVELHPVVSVRFR